MINYIATVWNSEIGARQIIGIGVSETQCDRIIMEHKKQAKENYDTSIFEDYKVQSYKMNTMIYDLGV